MSSRRKFIKQVATSTATLSIMPYATPLSGQSVPSLQISLAQWSLNRAIRDGEIKAEDFASITRNSYGLNAVEFVASFYREQKNKGAFWTDMLQRSKNAGVKNLLIMVDEEGDLGDPNDQARAKAVENHYGWVDAAKGTECHSIRVNAFGTGTRSIVKNALIDGMGRLCEYGSQAGINILIENHGLYSSEADFVVEVIKQVDSPYMGTLPDFGNWCTTQKWGGTRDDSCENAYDLVEGVKAFMPYAKGVSAKSYDFDASGGQPRLAYASLLQVVRNAGYRGYIGIEYEGENLSEPDGIKATKALIEKVWATLN